MYFSGRAYAQQAQGPGFNPQYQNTKVKAIDKLMGVQGNF